jgi:hypothetical protein
MTHFNCQVLWDGFDDGTEPTIKLVFLSTIANLIKLFFFVTDAAAEKAKTIVHAKYFQLIVVTLARTNEILLWDKRCGLSQKSVRDREKV